MLSSSTAVVTVAGAAAGLGEAVAGAPIDQTIQVALHAAIVALLALLISHLRRVEREDARRDRRSSDRPGSP